MSGERAYQVDNSGAIFPSRASLLITYKMRRFINYEWRASGLSLLLTSGELADIVDNIGAIF